MTQSLPPRSLVLYADDDEDDKQLVIDAFNEHARNVELITFNDGIELMDYVGQMNPDDHLPCLIILDINMPRLNGKETLRRLRNTNGFSDIPAVIFTTSSMPADEIFAQRFQAGFVTKPIVTPQIYQIIDQIIDHCTDEVQNRIRKKGSSY